MTTRWNPLGAALLAGRGGNRTNCRPLEKHQQLTVMKKPLDGRLVYAVAAVPLKKSALLRHAEDGIREDSMR